MKGNVSGYVCNHGSPSGEQDTASPGLWAMLQMQASDEELDDVFSRRRLYYGRARSDVMGFGRPTDGVFTYVFSDTSHAEGVPHSDPWGTQCLVPHSGNHGYIRNLRRFLACVYKFLSSFIMTFVSQDSYPSASHHKCNAISGELPSKFTMSEKVYL